MEEEWMRCDICGKERGAGRLPQGCKIFSKQTHCEVCWNQRHVLRSIVVPLNKVIPALKEKLFECWEVSRALGNWAMVTLFANDIRRTPDMEKLPKYKQLDLYHLLMHTEAGEYYDKSHWKGSKQSANLILRRAQQAYIKQRWDVLWAGNASLVSYRGGALPYPLDRDQWCLSLNNGGELSVKLSLPGGPKEAMLKGGPGFRRQRHSLTQVIQGEVLGAEASLYLKKRLGDDGLRHAEYMIRFVVWLPRSCGPVVGDRTLFVYTRNDRFLEADADWLDEPWVVNADHFKNKILGHHIAAMHRSNEDLKYEKRWPKKIRDRMVADRQARVRKNQNRLDTFVHETTTSLTNFAKRTKVKVVILDLSRKDFMPRFPYFQWKAKLAYKLDEHGILLKETKGAASAEVIE